MSPAAAGGTPGGKPRKKYNKAGLAASTERERVGQGGDVVMRYHGRQESDVAAAGMGVGDEVGSARKMGETGERGAAKRKNAAGSPIRREAKKGKVSKNIVYMPLW